MAKFVVKRLDEYLKVILEDFGSQNVNSSLFKGDVKLANARVRSDFLKEILQFPNIEIKEAVLSELQIHIPWTSIRKEAVSVDIDTLRVVLFEPEHLTVAATSLLSIFKKKEEESKKKEDAKAAPQVSWNFGLQIACGVRITIKSIEFAVDNLVGFKDLRPPSVMLRVRNIKIASVDQHGRPSTLKDCFAHNDQLRDIVKVYKSVDIERIEVCLLSGKLSSEIVSIPATSGLIVLTFDKKPLALVNLKVQLNLDRVQIGCMREDANGLILFLLSLGRCLFRERQSEAQLLGLADSDQLQPDVPQAPSAEHDADVQDYDVDEGDGEESHSGSSAVPAGSDAEHTAAGVVDIHVTLKTLRVFLIGDNQRIEIGNIMRGPQANKPSQIEVRANMQWLQIDGKLCSHVGATECIRTVTSLELPILAIDACCKDGSDRQRLLAVSIPGVTLSFLHPRPIPPAIGFSVQAAIENLYIRADLEQYWFIFRFFVSPTIEEVLSREPALFVRLGRFLYTNKATNPFNIYESEFSVGLSLGFSSIFVPLYLRGSCSNDETSSSQSNVGSGDTCICVSFVGASLKAASVGSGHSTVPATSKVHLSHSSPSSQHRLVSWNAELNDLTATSATVPAVDDPLTIHIPSVDDILGQFLDCASATSPLLLMKPLTVSVNGNTALPNIQVMEHLGGGTARDRGRSDASIASIVSTDSELVACNDPTSKLRIHVELLDLALSSRGITLMLDFTTKLLDWFQQQQLLNLVAFFQNLESALLSSTRTLEKEAVMQTLPSVGPDYVKATFFLDLVRISIVGESIDIAATPGNLGSDSANGQDKAFQRSVSGIRVTIENAKMILSDKPKVHSHIEIEVSSLDVQVATADSGKPSCYHSLLSSRQPSPSACRDCFDLPTDFPNSASQPFLTLALDVTVNPSILAPIVNGKLNCRSIWLFAAPEVVTSLIGAFLQEPLLLAAHKLSLVVVPYVHFAAASFGREHSAHVQALQDFSISVNLGSLYVLVSSNFGSNQCISLSLSGACVDASAKFSRGKEDAGVSIHANASLHSLGAWTRGGDGIASLHQMCTIEGLKFAIAQHRDSLNDPWVVDTLNFQAPETFKLTTSKEHMLTFKRLQAKAEEQLPFIIKAGSRLHAFFKLADPPIFLNASDEHDVKLVGRELPEASISALEWTCVYVLGQRQHPGVLSARSTGGLSKGNELVFNFTDSKTSGSSSVVIPFDSISSVAQGNIALVFPVSIEVQAAGVLHVFAHFINRDRAFRQMRDLFQNYQHMSKALSQSKARVVSIRSTVESIARRLKDVDDMFISFHNMSEHFDQFCDLSDKLGLQLRQRYPVHIAPSPVPQASTSAELAAILAAAGAANASGTGRSSRQKKSELPPPPPLPPAMFEGWVNIIPESEQLAAAAAEADAANAKGGFFSGMVKTIKESAAQTDAKLLASVPLAIRKSAKNARYCAMGREGSCKLYSDEPTPTNEKLLVREVIPLFGCVCSLQQRAVNKLASKFGVSSDDAMLKQIRITDASGRPLLLFTPFDATDLSRFLSAAQMSAMTPHEDAASSKVSSDAADILDPSSDSPTAPLAHVPPRDDGSPDDVSSAVVTISEVKGETDVVAGHSPSCEPTTPPPALHPNAVAGENFVLASVAAVAPTSSISRNEHSRFDEANARQCPAAYIVCRSRSQQHKLGRRGEDRCSAFSASFSFTKPLRSAQSSALITREWRHALFKGIGNCSMFSLRICPIFQSFLAAGSLLLNSSP